MSVADIGCCGAYCKPCRAFRAGACKGCKLGYAEGGRDIARAKCPIKACCLAKGFSTCGDCPGYEGCGIIQPFHRREGYKYDKYRQATVYIRANGYKAFLAIADGWRDAYGPYGRDGA
jgi:hypothetical protein